jgi:hypothetical protein
MELAEVRYLTSYTTVMWIFFLWGFQSKIWRPWTVPHRTREEIQKLPSYMVDEAA